MRSGHRLALRPAHQRDRRHRVLEGADWRLIHLKNLVARAQPRRLGGGAIEGADDQQPLPLRLHQRADTAVGAGQIRVEHRELVGRHVGGVVVAQLFQHPVDGPLDQRLIVHRLLKIFKVDHLPNLGQPLQIGVLLGLALRGAAGAGRGGALPRDKASGKHCQQRQREQPRAPKLFHRNSHLVPYPSTHHSSPCSRVIPKGNPPRSQPALWGRHKILCLYPLFFHSYRTYAVVRRRSSVVGRRSSVVGRRSSSQVRKSYP